MFKPKHTVQSRSSRRLNISPVMWFNLLLVFSTIIPIISAFWDGVHSDVVIIAIFLILILVAGWNFASSSAKSGISCFSATWFFFLIFFGLIPLIQYRSGAWLFRNISASDPAGILETQLLVASFIVIWALSYRIVFRKCSRRGIRFSRAIDSRRFLISPGVQLVFIGASVAAVGVSGMFFRGAQGEGNAMLGSTSILIASNVLRPAALAIAGIYLLIWREHKTIWNSVFVTLLLVLGLAANLPTSLPRYYLLAMTCMLLCPLLIGTRAWLWIGVPFWWIGFVGGILADRFRALKDNFDSDKFQIDSLGDYFFAGHFDAFELCYYASRHVAEIGITWGRQISGTLLFWFPRSAWSDKPMPTGQLLGERFINGMVATSNTNLSAPPLAEGYLDFWWPGVVLMAVIIGAIFARVDSWTAGCELALYQKRIKLSQCGGLVVCGAIMGLVPFIMRGSLMNAFAYSSGIFVACTLSWILLSRKLLPINRRLPVARGNFAQRDRETET